ncbi:major facilitator superfamily domain-containing protein [Radiomyces spectabilis]|uniref:major facilitator superfamily domain-containing protein n=1 Tax=Radiomyces spectabilis TaxID=64574 RepID=UPI002220D5B0|nr:major facilitator superfamily domain-containing protein [Radiomyces spectabilis]KAI8369630.1 major facilitator superfamily domain-containing protein [Radiomyces spectabilis]
MGAGTLADIFEPKERGRAFALYTCGPLLGPAIGPIVGGYLNEGLGWQSNFWLVAIFGFMIWLAILLFLPETWRAAPALPTTSVVEQTKKKSPRWHVNPLSALKLFRYLNISLTVLFISMFLVFYLVNTLFTRTYTIQYGMDSGTVGLCYLPMAAGAMSGSNIGGRISDRVYNRRVKQANGEAVPEMRISFVIIGICLFIQMAAFTAYGWCVQKNVHFAYGLVCLFFVALGLMVPLVTVSTYIVDCFRRRSASVTGNRH